MNFHFSNVLLNWWTRIAMVQHPAVIFTSRDLRLLFVRWSRSQRKHEPFTVNVRLDTILETHRVHEFMCYDLCCSQSLCFHLGDVVKGASLLQWQRWSVFAVLLSAHTHICKTHLFCRKLFSLFLLIVVKWGLSNFMLWFDSCKLFSAFGNILVSLWSSLLNVLVSYLVHS